MSKKLKKENYSSVPCDFDHNGECLICDCWASDCGWERLIKNDEKYESLEELREMFKDFLQNHPQKIEIENGKF